MKKHLCVKLTLLSSLLLQQSAFGMFKTQAGGLPLEEVPATPPAAQSTGTTTAVPEAESPFPRGEATTERASTRTEHACPALGEEKAEEIFTQLTKENKRFKREGYVDPLGKLFPWARESILRVIRTSVLNGEGAPQPRGNLLKKVTQELEDVSTRICRTIYREISFVKWRGQETYVDILQTLKNDLSTKPTYTQGALLQIINWYARLSLSESPMPAELRGQVNQEEYAQILKDGKAHAYKIFCALVFDFIKRNTPKKFPGDSGKKIEEARPVYEGVLYHLLTSFQEGEALEALEEKITTFIRESLKDPRPSKLTQAYQEAVEKLFERFSHQYGDVLGHYFEMHSIGSSGYSKQESLKNELFLAQKNLEITLEAYVKEYFEALEGVVRSKTPAQEEAVLILAWEEEAPTSPQALKAQVEEKWGEFQGYLEGLTPAQVKDFLKRKTKLEERVKKFNQKKIPEDKSLVKDIEWCKREIQKSLSQETPPAAMVSEPSQKLLSLAPATALPALPLGAGTSAVPAQTPTQAPSSKLEEAKKPLTATLLSPCKDTPLEASTRTALKIVKQKKKEKHGGQAQLQEASPQAVPAQEERLTAGPLSETSPDTAVPLETTDRIQIPEALAPQPSPMPPVREEEQMPPVKEEEKTAFHHLRVLLPDLFEKKAEVSSQAKPGAPQSQQAVPKDQATGRGFLRLPSPQASTMKAAQSHGLENSYPAQAVTKNKASASAPKSPVSAQTPKATPLQNALRQETAPATPLQAIKTLEATPSGKAKQKSTQAKSLPPKNQSSHKRLYTPSLASIPELPEETTVAPAPGANTPQQDGEKRAPKALEAPVVETLPLRIPPITSPAEGASKGPEQPTLSTLLERAISQREAPVQRDPSSPQHLINLLTSAWRRGPVEVAQAPQQHGVDTAPKALEEPVVATPTEIPAPPSPHQEEEATNPSKDLVRGPREAAPPPSRTPFQLFLSAAMKKELPVSPPPRENPVTKPKVTTAVFSTVPLQKRKKPVEMKNTPQQRGIDPAPKAPEEPLPALINPSPTQTQTAPFSVLQALAQEGSDSKALKLLATYVPVNELLQVSVSIAPTEAPHRTSNGALPDQAQEGISERTLAWFSFDSVADKEWCKKIILHLLTYLPPLTSEMIKDSWFEALVMAERHPHNPSAWIMEGQLSMDSARPLKAKVTILFTDAFKSLYGMLLDSQNVLIHSGAVPQELEEVGTLTLPGEKVVKVYGARKKIPLVSSSGTHAPLLPSQGPSYPGGGSSSRQGLFPQGGMNQPTGGAPGGGIGPQGGNTPPSHGGHGFLLP